MVLPRKKKLPEKKSTEPVREDSAEEDSEEELVSTQSVTKTGMRFSPDGNGKPDAVYTVFLILGIVLFIAVTIIAGMEAVKFYDTPLFFFKKQ